MKELTNDEALRQFHFQDERQEQFKEINDRMLNGLMDFETAHQEVVGTSGKRGQIKTYSRTEIIEENRLNFAKIMEDELKPFRRVVEAMDASYDSEKGPKPDWTTRLSAIRLYMQLTGHDPKQGLIVQFNDQSVTITIDKLYAAIAKLDTEEARVQAYNQVIDAEKRGLIMPRVVSPLGESDGE